MASKEEQVTLKLENQISGAADAATGSLGRLESQILREEAALGRLEENLTRARAQLSAMADGTPSPAAVAAFERQGAAVAQLEAKMAAATGPTEKLAGDLERARAKLVQLGEAASGKVNVEAYRRQSSAVAAMGDRIGAQKDKIAGLRDKLTEGGKAAKDAHVPFRAIGGVAKELGGSAGAAESSIVRLTHHLIKMGPALAAIVIGAVAVIGAVVLMASVFAKAVSAASDLRDEHAKLASAGVTLWNGLRASRVAADQLQESVNNVSSNTALARDKIADYAVSLREAQFLGRQMFQGKELEKVLEATAIAATGGSEKVAASVIESAKAAKLFGGDIDKLAERIKLKFGEQAAEKMRSLDVQMMKLHENIAFIFSGADIEPLLVALQAVLSIFNKNEGAAKSLRAMVTKFTEYAIGKILDLTIVLLKAYIWLRTHHNAWAALIMTVKGFGIALAVAVGVALVALVPLALKIAAIGAALIAAGMAVTFIYDQFKWLFTNFGEFAVGLYNIGKDIIMGLVNGIKAAGSKVFQALKGIVFDAIGGIKKFLGIGSPSLLMRHEVGFQMGAGVALGHQDSAPMVKQSATAMAEAGVEGSTGTAPSIKISAPSAPAASSGGGATLQFTNCTFGGDLTESTVGKWFAAALEKANFSAPEPT